MAYCAMDDVRQHNPQFTYDVESKPTLKQVEGMITDIAAEIDTILSARGLTVPVTTPAHFLAHLKYINSIGAAALAEFASFHAAAGVITEGHGNELWKIYVDARNALRDQSLPVAPVAISGGTGSMPFSYFQRNTSDDSYDAKMGKEKVY